MSDVSFYREVSSNGDFGVIVASPLGYVETLDWAKSVLSDDDISLKLIDDTSFKVRFSDNEFISFDDFIKSKELDGLTRPKIITF
jgi:hypothetical protein